MPENALFSYRTPSETDLLLADGPAAWSGCEKVVIDRDWRGRSMLNQKGHNWRNLTRICSRWNHDFIFLYVECWFDTLDIDCGEAAASNRKAWEMDAVQFFIKPESRDDYYRLEINPCGDWLDTHIIQPKTDMDHTWASKLSLSVRINPQEQIWHILAGLPFSSVLSRSQRQQMPEVGEAWKLNICRVVAGNQNKEYLFWRPTFTDVPDFHLPATFGNLIFLEH